MALMVGVSVVNRRGITRFIVLLLGITIKPEIEIK